MNTAARTAYAGKAFVSITGLLVTGALLASCTNPPGSNGGVTSQVSDIESVSPALAKYDAERVQALWDQDSLSDRDRSLVTIATLISSGQSTELGFYVGRALDDGVAPEEVSETVTHLAFYSGWQNAKAAVEPIAAVFDDRGIEDSSLPQANPELLPQNQAAEQARATNVQEQYGNVSQGVVDDTREVLFNDLWLRPGLEPRDRSLITVVALVSTAQAAQIPYHLGRAMDAGLTTQEIDGVLKHLAYFTGWPKVFSAMPVVRDVIQAR